MANGETRPEDVMSAVQRGTGRNAKIFWIRIGVAFLISSGLHARLTARTSKSDQDAS